MAIVLNRVVVSSPPVSGVPVSVIHLHFMRWRNARGSSLSVHLCLPGNRCWAHMGRALGWQIRGQYGSKGLWSKWVLRMASEMPAFWKTFVIASVPTMGLSRAFMSPRAKLCPAVCSSKIPIHWHPPLVSSGSFLVNMKVRVAPGDVLSGWFLVRPGVVNKGAWKTNKLATLAWNRVLHCVLEPLWEISRGARSFGVR